MICFPRKGNTNKSIFLFYNERDRKYLSKLALTMQSYVYRIPFIDEFNFLKDIKSIKEEVNLYIASLREEKDIKKEISLFYQFLGECLNTRLYTSINAIYFHELLHSLYHETNVDKENSSFFLQNLILTLFCTI